MARLDTVPTPLPSSGERAGLLGMWREGLLLVSAAAMLVALYLIFMWVPEEVNQGQVQRIMYLHVPIALSGLAVFGLVFVGSVMYLWKGGKRWDALAYSSAEVGALLLTLILITGTIWAKPIWNTWWTGEPLLNMVLVLWLMAVAYLMLRAYAPSDDRGARFAGVLGVIAGLTSPFVYFAVQLLGSISHPGHELGPDTASGASLAGSIQLTLLVSFAAISLFVVYLLVQRYSLRVAEDELNAMHQYYEEERAVRGLEHGREHA